MGEAQKDYEEEMNDVAQVPSGPPSNSYRLFEAPAARASGGDQAPTGPAALAPGGDLYEEDAGPNHLDPRVVAQLGVLRPDIDLSTMIRPTAGMVKDRQSPASPFPESMAAAMKLLRELVYLSIRIMKRS